MKELPNLYTSEVIVFRSGVNAADLSRPITVVEDVTGNHIVQDGNHRAKRSELTGEPVRRIAIGQANTDVASNPDYRLIADVQVVDK